MAEPEDCTTCKKTASIAKCHGCQKQYCMAHFVKHRLHLAEFMDHLHEKCEILKNDIKKNHFEKSLLSNIDEWEQKSIKRIHEIAEQARIDLQRKLEKLMCDVEITLNKIILKFDHNAKTDNYTEIDLEKWTKEISELRHALEKSSEISCVENDKFPSTLDESIVMTSTQQQQQSLRTNYIPDTDSFTSEQSAGSIPEHFVPVYGPCKLSEDRSVVTQSSYRGGLSQITGFNSYSSGRHSISFLIEHKSKKNIFFGIHSLSNENASTFDRSIYGWWNIDYIIINGEHQCGNNDQIIKTGDKITLTLDCHNQYIQFEHHQTQRLGLIHVKLNECPLPWKILIRLLNKGDSIRIIR